MKMNFCRVLRQLAVRHGDREALVNVERQRRYTHREYHLLTNRIANALRSELRVGAGDTFMLILENDNLALFQFATVAKQEGTVVLTNLRDSLDEHTWQVGLVKPKVVFVETRLLDSHYDMLRAGGCEIVAMDAPAAPRAGVRPFWDLINAAPDEDNEVELDTLGHLFMLRFTGGTTGRGKCAMYTVDNMLACADSGLNHRELEFSAATRMLHVAPLSHGTMMMFYPAYFAGGTNLTLNQLDLQKWREVVETERVTHSFLVPTILYRLLEMQRARPLNLSSLTTIIYGAAPMSPTKLADLVGCFGNIFAQGYAATEAPQFIAVLDKAEHRPGDEVGAKRLSSAGRVTSGVEVFVTDGDGKTLPAGQVGEIRIRSRAVIRGYYQNPEGSAAEFVDGAWRSGDLGYLDADGFLYIVDRLKDMIISGGFNVYAVEVESALSSHSAVLNSAVVGVPHAEWGEAVHAEVVLRPGAQATADELIAHVKRLIGSYKAPKSVTFVAELPLSVVGKVLRRKVKEKYWQDMSRRVA
jgi:acyl-CoA synthetase (AMP-forming)/AMP-acid ligase II